MMLSDKQLQDYLAGTGPLEEALIIEAGVMTDAELEARLFALDFSNAKPLREAFDLAVSPETLQALEKRIPDTQTKSTLAVVFDKIKWGAAAAALVAIGFGLSNLKGQPEPRWRDQVASYHALYVAQTLASITLNDAQLAEQLSQGEQALGRSLPVDVVGSLGDSPLLRTQVLGFKDTPLVQMAYLTNSGVPVALCAIPSKAEPSTEILYETLSGLPTASWSDGAYSYMIVGDIDDNRLTAMAQNMRDTL